MGNREWRIQLMDAWTGENIVTAGGTCHVSTAGSPDKATLLTKAGAALANPITPTRGFINFFVVDTVDSVDLYIQAPGGQFVVLAGVKPSGPNEIAINTAKKDQLYKIPFSIADSVAATEKDTGFDLPALCFVLDRLHGCGLHVTALDATEDIDVGTGEVNPTETGGDANGFIAASDLDNAVLVTGTNGALFSTNAPYRSDANAAKSITYTLTTGTDTAKGFILMPIVLV